VVRLIEPLLKDSPAAGGLPAIVWRSSGVPGAR
jgi:hypothetical protein